MAKIVISIDELHKRGFEVTGLVTEGESGHETVSVHAHLAQSTLSDASRIIDRNAFDALRNVTGLSDDVVTGILESAVDFVELQLLAAVLTDSRT